MSFLNSLQRTAALLALITGACARDLPFPADVERTDSYVLLAAATRTQNAGMLLSLLSDSVSTTWDSAAVLGIDNVAAQWRKIQIEGKIDLIARRMSNTRQVVPGRMRDSGQITFRLLDPTQSMGFRDTTMTFMTHWLYEREQRQWKIISDSITPVR